jgi:hypothetical protein
MQKLTLTLLIAVLASASSAFASAKQVRLTWVQTSQVESTSDSILFKNETVHLSVDNIGMGRHENKLRLVAPPETIQKINKCIEDSQAIGPRGRLSIEYRVLASDSKKITRAKSNAPLVLNLPADVYCERQMGYTKLISDSFVISSRSPASEKSARKLQIDARLIKTCQRQGGVFKGVQAIQSHLAKNSLNTYQISADIICFFK